MHAIVTKEPDGVLFMTRDGFGELVNEELALDDAVTFGDNTLKLVSERLDERTQMMVGPLVQFSWVDYRDTSTPGVPSKGVRHTHEWPAPGSLTCGPYSVVVSDDAAAVASAPVE